MECPLTAAAFTRKDVDDIMKPPLKTVLPMRGIQKRIPFKLPCGNIEACGFGVKDLHLLQLISHPQAILRHSNRDTPSHDLIQENMEMVQTCVGSDVPFWELPFPLHGDLVPNGWMKSTWAAPSETNLTLQGPDITRATQQ